MRLTVGGGLTVTSIRVVGLALVFVTIAAQALVAAGVDPSSRAPSWT